MDRREMIRGLAHAGANEVLSGRIIAAHEDLGSRISGALFEDISDLYMDVFDEKTEMTIRMEFLGDGVKVSVPALGDCEYRLSVIAYEDLGDNELEALHGLAWTTS